MPTLGRAILILLLLLAFSGCDYLGKNTTTSTEPATSTAAKPTVTAAATIPAEQIEMFDMVMHRSDERALTGDLRPFWTVSGRIRNNSRDYLGELRLRIYIRGKADEIQDEANLQLETDVSPGSVGSFSRKIQTLTPQKAWDWTYEVVEARTRSNRVQASSPEEPKGGIAKVSPEERSAKPEAVGGKYYSKAECVGIARWVIHDDKRLKTLTGIEVGNFWYTLDNCGFLYFSDPKTLNERPSDEQIDVEIAIDWATHEYIDRLEAAIGRLSPAERDKIVNDLRGTSRPIEGKPLWASER